MHPSSLRVPPAFQKLLCLEHMEAVKSFYLDLAVKGHGLGEVGPPDLGVFAAPVPASGFWGCSLSRAAQGLEANVYQRPKVTLEIKFCSIEGIILWGWRNKYHGCLSTALVLVLVFPAKKSS